MHLTDTEGPSQPNFRHSHTTHCYESNTPHSGTVTICLHPL